LEERDRSLEALKGQEGVVELLNYSVDVKNSEGYLVTPFLQPISIINDMAFKDEDLLRFMMSIMITLIEIKERHSIVHLDIKPENIMFSASKTPLLNLEKVGRA
jgi:serine/threonine protein kinase